MMYRRTGRPKGLDLSITAPTIRSQSLPCSGEGTTYIPASQGFSAFTVGRRVATLAASCRGYARASAPADPGDRRLRGSRDSDSARERFPRWVGSIAAVSGIALMYNGAVEVAFQGFVASFIKLVGLLLLAAWAFVMVALMWRKGRRSITSQSTSVPSGSV